MTAEQWRIVDDLVGDGWREEDARRFAGISAWARAWPLNPWLLPPLPDQPRRKFIGIQLCQWDDDPAEDWGLVWFPVCLYCLRGPLDEGRVACGECVHDHRVGSGWYAP
jgi:hypothetical protein